MAGNRAGEERLRAGIEAARQGDRANAQKLLRQVVTSDPNNEIAWMWLASVSESVQERRTCLERALRINPNNTRAQEALRQLDAIAPRPAARAAAARQARQAAAERTGINPIYLIIGGVVVLAVLGAILLGASLGQPPPAPNAQTVAAFAVSPTFTSTPNPASFTATPFFGVIVEQATVARTLPPTFTATFTLTPTPQPPPTATLPPLTTFTLLYTGAGAGDAQPALFRSGGTVASPQTVGASDQGFSDVTFSPNGQSIAFVRSLTYTNADGVEVTAPELFVAPADNPGAARQVTQLGGGRLADPTWAPDSIQLVFVSDLGGDDNLWYITEDGNNLRPLTNNLGVDKDPAWSPDGSVILYASDQGGLPGSGITQIFSITPDGETIVQITTSGNSSYSPAWSPDGARVAFASDRNGDGDIFLIDPDGQRLVLLTQDDRGAEDRWPAFSPDGRWVVFSSNREGDTFQLYQVDLDGRQVSRLTNVAEAIQSFAFRPEPFLQFR